MRLILSLSNKFLDIFFPKICGHCGDAFHDGLSNILCLPCFNGIEPYQNPSCDHCGISLPPRAFEDAADCRCADCGDEVYYLDKTSALGSYEGPLRLAHHAFKFGGMEHLKRPMIQKMVKNMPTDTWRGIEALVPVAMSPEKEREKGYHPSLLLANELSASIGIPVKLLLNKTRPTVAQRLLTREKRLQNQKGTYQTVLRGPLLKVLLVDDVFTTGATLEECAKVLKKAGVEWVGAVVWGRTPRYGSDRSSD
ncbi:MAG TPA: ComF family protein [bacterium]|jgi:ComF family protein|nr:ComF family protein [bacterium]